MSYIELTYNLIKPSVGIVIMKLHEILLTRWCSRGKNCFALVNMASLWRTISCRSALITCAIAIDEMESDVRDSMTQTATLPTLEEREQMADQLKALHSRTRESLRLVTERVGETSRSCNDHLHILLQVQDLHEGATRCLEQGDVSRAYELVKAVDSYIPIEVSHWDYMYAKRLTIPCLVLPLVAQEETQFYSGRTGTGGPLDVAVGIDSDSAITATTNRSDLVSINTGSSFLHNASVTGVGGGVSKIGGMGAMIVRVKVTKPNGTKEWGCLCDPNAAWLKKEN